MSVKILGGLARGFPLATPRTETTRPTSVLVRRKLFDWRQSLEGEVFVDLFAGSGAMGFEALSRGADRVFLNDSHRIAFQTLKQNAEKLVGSFKLEPTSVNVTNLEGLRWLGKELGFELADTTNVVLYIDPPYADHELYFKVLEELTRLSFAGEIWLEADRLKGPAKEKLAEAFKSVNKTVEQGDHFVLVGKVI
jgi:16S rRNA (guanine966-N2)-methyltransferase